MAKVIVTAQSFCKDKTLCEELVARGKGLFEVAFLPEAHALPAKQLVAALSDAEAVLVGRETFDAPALGQLPRLRCLSKYGVGLDNIDQEACREQGVALFYRAGVNAQAVAEHAMGLVLSLMRNIDQSSRKLREGLWWKNGGTGLTGKTFGVIGFGHTGSRVGRLAKAFGCELLVADKVDKKAEISPYSGRQVALKELLESSDIISIHVPLAEDTRNLIDRTAISLMKTGAFLINTARGGVVDEKALLDALNSGKLAGAGADVFVNEPRPPAELVSHERFLGTAHIAGNSTEAVQAMGRAAIDGILEYFAQRPGR